MSQNKFASDKRAIADCDVCGFQYKLKELKENFRNNRGTNILACPTCWDEENPQEMLGTYPVIDAIAIRNPRSDFAGLPASRSVTLPVTTVPLQLRAGEVTVA